MDTSKTTVNAPKTQSVSLSSVRIMLVPLNVIPWALETTQMVVIVQGTLTVFLNSALGVPAFLLAQLKPELGSIRVGVSALMIMNVNQTSVFSISAQATALALLVKELLLEMDALAPQMVPANQITVSQVSSVSHPVIM